MWDCKEREKLKTRTKKVLWESKEKENGMKKSNMKEWGDVRELEERVAWEIEKRVLCMVQPNVLT